MSTLPGRTRTALIVIDVQTGVVARAWERDAVVRNISDLVTRARAAGAPVVWVQHEDGDLKAGTDPWRIVSELVPAEGEPVIAKRYPDAFEETGLEAALAEAGVGSVVICGAQTDFCIRSGLHGALVRGYDTLLVSDAHTTEDLSNWGAPPPEQVIRHTNLYWRGQTAPGRVAGVAKSEDVRFAPDGVGPAA